MITRITKSDMSREMSGDVTSILIMDDFGNPLAVYLQRADGLVFSESAAKPDEFRKMLTNLGIDWKTEYSNYRVDKTKRGSHTLTPV